MESSISDERITDAMRLAAKEARRWLGSTSPNPPVGAVALASDGRVLAVTAHERAGAPHAEAALISLLSRRKMLKEVALLCVTLEPCNHEGRTPPCVDAILASGIPAIAIGTRDPNPKVAGGGIERLKDAGIDVKLGIAQDECRQLIASFAYSVQRGLPFVTIKQAFDRKGSLIPPPGQKTFTSPPSLRLAHQLRKKADGIIAGSGTILADDPLFTVRFVPDHAEKRRWLGIIDRRRRVGEAYLAAASERGLDAMVYETPEIALKDLANRQAVDVLIEAGPALSEAIFASHLWTMSVSVHQGDPDHIEVAFNPRETMPFAIDLFCWEWALPG